MGRYENVMSFIPYWNYFSLHLVSYPRARQLCPLTHEDFNTRDDIYDVRIMDISQDKIVLIDFTDRGYHPTSAHP